MILIFPCIVVGADRIAKNGDTANKVSTKAMHAVSVSCSDSEAQIGTYNAAVLAARHKIPFIVVAPITTVDIDIADGSQ